MRLSILKRWPLAATIAALGVLLVPALASAQEDGVQAGAATKKAEKKDSLVEEEKKVAPAKPKRNEDELQKGGFAYERLEQAGFDEKQRRIQIDKAKIRERSIKTLEQQIEKNPRAAEVPDYLFRLAENWWEETKFRYLMDRLEYDGKMVQFEKGILTEKPVQPVENYQNSIANYEKILQQFPNYPRMGEILYRVGKACLQQGKANGDRVLSQSGVKYLNQLIQRFQTHALIPQAHLALAEHFFENNNLTLAKMNYEKITQNYRSTPLFNYALYKLGWVYYNLREFQRTIETFQAVVKEIGKDGDRGKIEFRDQALKDLVQAFAELDGAWPKAKDYFTSVEGEAKAWDRLYKMAEIYVAIDKDKDAVDLYSHFIENKQTDARCVDWFDQIVEVNKKLGAFSDIEGAMRKFLAFTDDRTSAWVAAQRGRKSDRKSQDALEKSAEMGERYLLFISNYYHQLAQKTEDETKDAAKAAPYYTKAVADYEEFTRRYPASKKAYIVSFYKAEILYDQLQKYDEARVAYEKTIELDPQGEFVEDAALGVIYATEELMRKRHACYNDKLGKWEERADCPPLVATVEGEGVKVTKTKEKKELTEEQIKAAQVPKARQELHPLEVSYVNAAEKYVKLMEKAKADCQAGTKKQCGKGKKVPEIMYLAASAYYDRGQYKEAVDGYERVYNYETDNKVAEIAVRSLIDIYARQREWAKIEEWARTMLKRKNRIVLETKDLRKYVAVSVAEQAFELTEKKDFDAAHQKFDTILREFRTEEPEMAAISLFNKAKIYELQKEDKTAIDTYERVVKDFPKSKIAPEAKFQVGMLYEAMTQFKEAADAFLDMAKFRDNSDAAQALINAGQIMNALQQYKESAAAYDKFIGVANALKGDDAETKRLKGLVADAEMEKGHVLERLGADGAKAASAAYNAVVTRYPARADLHVEALGRKVETLRLADPLKNRKEAIATAEATAKAFAKPEGKGPKSSSYVAQALFYRSEYEYDDFNALTLKNVKNMKGLLPMLQKKAESLKKAETAYFSVFDQAAAGGGKAWAAASMFRVGMLYYNFKEDLFNAPVPPQIQDNPDLEDAYKREIEKLAVPIEEQALAALRNAINVAHNLGVYNKWSKQAGDYAAKVSPDEYPTVEKDANLPKAAETVSADSSTDPATSAAFVTTVRRGKLTVSYKPKTEAEAAPKAQDKPAAPQAK
jgi:tetratricopeptide (TPR) repeat protein